MCCRLQVSVRPVPDTTPDALHFTQDNPRGLVFFLHDYGGNLQTWTTGIDFYRRVNYDLFIVDEGGEALAVRERNTSMAPVR